MDYTTESAVSALQNEAQLYSCAMTNSILLLADAH